MTTETDLVNQALAKIGEFRVEDYDSDSTSVGILARDIFHARRKLCLAQHEWTFAKVQAELSQLGLTPTGGYSYVYGLPGSMIKLGLVADNSDFDPVLDQWMQGEIEDGDNKYQVIYASTDYLFITYVRDHTTYGHWPAWFVEYFTVDLATAFAPRLLSPSAAKDYIKVAMVEKGQARSIDSLQQPVRRRPMGSWNAATRGARPR